MGDDVDNLVGIIMESSSIFKLPWKTSFDIFGRWVGLSGKILMENFRKVLPGFLKFINQK